MKNPKFQRNRRHQLPTPEREARRGQRVNEVLRTEGPIWRQDEFGTTDKARLKERDDFIAKLNHETEHYDRTKKHSLAFMTINDIFPPQHDNVVDITSSWDIHALEKKADEAHHIGDIAVVAEVVRIPVKQAAQPAEDLSAYVHFANSFQDMPAGNGSEQATGS